MNKVNGSSNGAALNTPNLFWGSVPAESLRSNPQYCALPEPDSVVITDPCHYRYDSRAHCPPLSAEAPAASSPPCHRSFLRQAPELREATHRGILTTANLKDALGFSEPDAAKLLGRHGQAGGGGTC